MSNPSCPRCAGLVADLYEDPHCLNCGWRRCEPIQLNQIERPILPERNQRERKSALTREEHQRRNREYMLEYWRRRRLEEGKRVRAHRKKKATV